MSQCQENTALLKKLRKKIPFLKQIPDNIFYNLDTSEFCLPSRAINNIRQNLELLTGHYVMTYKADTFNRDTPTERHLCANVLGARLNQEQLQILENLEVRVRKQNVSFIVYQRPLVLIDPLSSPLAAKNR